MQLGADGVVPGTGNLAPGLYTTICGETIEKEIKEAAMHQAERLSEMYQKGRSLSYALPVLKAMMSVYGLCKPEVLPPMYRLEEKEEGVVRSLLTEQFPDLDRINSIPNKRL
jgi:dihydrodipicolinate synthase/N-acetylneuraminate lyase